jgi:hypothetical protein
MLFPTVKCPFCGGLMPNDQYRSRGPWTCPACMRDLRIPRWYLRLLSWSSLAITFAFCFLLGLRGIRFFVALLIGSIPMYFIFRFALNIFVSTPLEVYPAEALDTIPPPPALREPPFKCPFCRSTFTAVFKRNQPINCPTCARKLMIAKWYEHLNFLLAIGLAWMLCVLLGLHGWELAVGIVVLWFPVMIAWIMFLGQIITTPLQAYALPIARRKSIRCPMSDKEFLLPPEWSHPPFPCPECHQQLQATVRFQHSLCYLFVIANTPIWFFGWINGRLLISCLYAVALFLVYAIASSLSAAIFPLKIEQYQSSVIRLNLTK